MAYDGTLPIEKRDDGQYEFAFHDVSILLSRYRIFRYSNM